MKPNREFQLDVLNALRDAYPRELHLGRLPAPPEGSDKTATIYYLGEHGLVDARRTPSFSDSIGITHARITAQGIDFLEDDGGLAAILGVVTIKLDPDDLRTLMVSRVESSDLPSEDKQSLIHAIGSYSAKVLREVTVRLVSEGLARSPDVLQLLQTGAGPS